MFKRLTTWLSVAFGGAILAAFAMLLASGSGGTTRAQGQSRWEYVVIEVVNYGDCDAGGREFDAVCLVETAQGLANVEVGAAAYPQALNVLGAQGWGVIAFGDADGTPITHLKRPLG